VLSGMAMSVAGTSRPCSGACHEIIHAVDALYPGRSNHGELAGIGALFAYFLRENNPLLAGGSDASASSPSRFDQIAACLSRHELPRLPADIGLTDAEFRDAVLKAPSTRPDRYTILEHLDFDSNEIDRQLAGFVQRLT
jgi:glycerol-1-phosphate dehydrogenase [NAD(P)+]